MPKPHVADVVSISSVSEVPASLLVKAAQAYKMPSPGSASPASKKPATKKGKSKPAKASSSSTYKPAKARPALIIADKNVWSPSLSFGYLKGTMQVRKLTLCISLRRLTSQFAWLMWLFQEGKRKPRS